MAAKLKNLKVVKVDFVDEGANPDANIVLLKRKDGEGGEPDANGEGVKKGGATSFAEELGLRRTGKIMDDMWNLCYALNDSLCSILCDDELDAAQKQEAMLSSVEEFTATTKEAVASWASGKPVGLVAKSDNGEMEKRLANRVAEEMAKSLERAYANMPMFKKNEETEPQATEGEETDMKINKSKMTAEERAMLEDFEKRYGVEDAGAAVEPAAQEPQGSGGTEPDGAGVAKSAVAAQEPKQTPAGDGEDIYKSLNPAVRKELEELKKFRQDAEDKELREVAEGYAILGRSADELFPILKGLKAKDQTAYEQMIATLDSAKTAVEKSGAFGEVGRTGNGTVARGGAVKEVEAKAAELMKSKAGLTRAQAIDRVLMEDPELAERYETEEE